MQIMWGCSSFIKMLSKVPMSPVFLRQTLSPKTKTKDKYARLLQNFLSTWIKCNSDGMQSPTFQEVEMKFCHHSESNLRTNISFRKRAAFVPHLFGLSL